MSQNIVTLTDANFSAETGKEPLPLLVDFWASWCGPCQMMAPVLEKVAEDFSGRLVVGKLNVDENQATARQFNVMSIPTLIIFKSGVEQSRITGFRPQEEITRLLNQALT
jgi:thioredoxin 1